MTRPDETSREIVDLAGRLFVAIWGHTQMRMSEAGLSMPEAKAILSLLPDETMSMRELAAATHASPSNATVTVDRLVLRDLVAREEGQDRRVRGIRLTGAGAALRQRLQSRIEVDHPALRGLDEDERETFLALLRRLTEAHVSSA